MLRSPLSLLILLALPLLLEGCISEIVRKVPSGPPLTDTSDAGGVPDQVAVDGSVDGLLVDGGDVVGDTTGDQVTPPDVPGDTVAPAAVVVGPDGGTFTLASGVTFVVPAGALAAEVELSAVASEMAPPEGSTPVTAVYEATPDGQTFALPITLRLPIADVSLQEGQWPLVKGFVGDGSTYETVSAWPDLANGEVWVQTDHFSAVLAGLPKPPTTCLEHELCDGEDNDCDGAVDEASDLKKDDATTGCQTDGVCALQVDVECNAGQWECTFKNPDELPAFYEPDTELSCDAKDNDCDGQTDEGLTGKLSTLLEFGALGIDCRVEGVCADAEILVACWQKSANSADWICDYSLVAGFEGDEELSCDGIDNDCDGEIDEGTCGQFEPCQDDSYCANGHCVVPLTGSDQSFCTDSETSCLAVNDDASLTEVPAEGTFCVDGLDHHLATCDSGEWAEPYLDCEDVEPVNPTCDSSVHQCTGGCNVDADCDLYKEPCTGDFFCNDDGECEEDVASGPQCHTLNWTCQEFACNPESGECVATSINAGVVCDDGDLCTGNGKCTDGACQDAVEKTCDDDNPCTEDYCDPETGSCVYDPEKFAGAPCDDESICTTNDVCGEDGVCAGQPKLCDDGNVCTQDGCSEVTGQCTFDLTPGAECDDEDPCTEPGTCSAEGQCQTTPLNCDDANACTKDECILGECHNDPDPSAQICPYPNAIPGEQDLCIPLGVCEEGICEPGNDLCECHDDDDCLELEDNFCDGTAKCLVGDGGLLKCVDQPETAVTCDPSLDSICLVNTCNPANGDCAMTAVEDGIECDDGDLCTDEDQCIAGECAGPTPVDCDDGNPCTKNLCLSETGCQSSPEPQGTACQDGDPCTTNDTCNNAGVCQAGTPKQPACDDDNICTTDTCTPDGAQCLFLPIEGCCKDNTDCDEEGGEFCTPDNVCCAPTCTDDQGNPLNCGDDGCGGTCGECNINAICIEGSCCFPNCYSPFKLCGDDGCGGSCGTCPQGNVCTEFFQCCSPQCNNKECGSDGCGGVCGNCGKGFLCNDDAGLCEVCFPACEGKECGDDGCGDVCGVCPQDDDICLEDGTCCSPDCTGKVCGDDGCGGSCGECDEWEGCNLSGQCYCEACCEGPDDCGVRELCVGEIQDGEETLSVCAEPLTVILDGFESYFQSTSPDAFGYEFTNTVPWTIRYDEQNFWTHTGAKSFRYYRVPVDDGGYFSFTRYLPTVAQGEFSLLSFYMRCNSMLVDWTLDVMAGDVVVKTLDNSFCDKLWHRYTADLSDISGPTEFRFVTTKTSTGGAEMIIDDLAIFVSKCPDDIPCATMSPEGNACEVASISDGFCFIDRTCYETDGFKPDSTCAFCSPQFSKTEWQTDDGLCDDGNPGTSEICDLKDGCYYF